MFRPFLVCLAAFALASPASAEDVLPSACAQVVAVVTETWESTGGRLIRLERKGEAWIAASESIPVTVGHRGLGVGLGLHRGALEGPIKNEGDHRAPAGVFRLESGFGTKALPPAAFPYRRTDDADRWVDDPESARYNQWVRLDDPSVRRDWASAETMHRRDGLYDFGIVVGHNRDPVAKGRGSAIFLHAWQAPGRSTVGCTAMEKRRVRGLLEWLDAAKAPVLVQAPRSLLPQIGLPESVLAAIQAALPASR